jgi:exosortase E/protease (VPEID-CTERM system)
VPISALSDSPPLTSGLSRFSSPLIRFTFASALLLLETFVFSLCFDTASLLHKTGLLTVISDIGPWVARAVGVFVVAFFAAAWSGRARGGDGGSIQIRNVNRTALVAHGASFACFSWLTYRLFSLAVSTTWNALAIAWIVAGVTLAATALLTFIPARAALGIVRQHRAALQYSVGIAAAACIVGRLSWLVSRPIHRRTFQAVSWCLAAVIPGLHIDPVNFTIDGGSFAVEVSRQCSGIEGIALVTVFVSGWIWFFRSDYRFPNALALIPAGVVLIWMLNVVRLSALFLIGYAGAPDVAAGGFHSQAGWLAFNATAIGLLVIGKRSPWFAHSTKATVSAGRNPYVPYLLPVIGIMATSMITRAMSGSGSIDKLYGLRLVGAALILYHFRSVYRRLDWHFDAIAPLLGIAVLALWLGLEPKGSKPTTTLLATLKAWPALASTGWIAVRILASSITVPIAEELAFRAFLIRRLMKGDVETLPPSAYSYTAVLISSVAFGCLHGDRWFVGILAGLIYSYAYLRRGRIGDAVVAHATTNGLIAAWVWVGGAWYLW